MADIVLGQHPLLKKEFVDKRIRDLIGHQFVADQLFTQTDVDALAIKYLKDTDTDAQGRQAYDEVPEVGEGSGFKRIGLDEEEKTAMIRKYGLEAVITYEMQKFGSAGQFERAYRKLALNVRKMVDGMAYKVLTNTASGILTVDGKDWGNATTGDANVISDLVDAKKAIRDYGYMADTAVISPETEARLMKSKSVRDALRQNNTDVALLRGYIGDFMGLSFIVDENFNDNDVLVLQKKVIGDIADAEALRTKTYNEESNDRSIVRATRFTQAYLTDPKAVFFITGVNA
ncbi:hypothetical protein HV436_01445 [Bacillus sporothermodurans]|uniref:phage major capsid protein n=1 Tax=Heyndrickxia sporothermodurans TaxID=46224 RepID=UPI00192ADBC6|nr:hypothetical protein [Heyndrickxia sporothermodurans]MBL5776999.1 hypothetical protein [Heyndrickxia sporothermodurans]MBL5798527.1 hypothetical protein [Heyndrickxia sporothermodurans]MBL5809445.1 hypothetical protein [Heyndrickxia sporothermodurans]MBL5813079.1 hypothetical protein [Heyndrickxia sporothermodurans]MBL5816503.1 hypothetical protein [Heyndrickxia sporothermodurans]